MIGVTDRDGLDVQPSGRRANPLAPHRFRGRCAPEAKAAVTTGMSAAALSVPTASASSTVGAVLGRTLGDAHQLAVVAAHPHQVVGEGQVGQQLPFAHHGVQVVDGVAGQDGVLGKQVTECRHGGLQGAGALADDGDEVAGLDDVADGHLDLGDGAAGSASTGISIFMDSRSTTVSPSPI